MDQPKKKNVTPWRTSKVLPQWTKHYFQWHQDSRKKISGINKLQDYDYLAVRCLNRNAKCGGGANRLKSLPFMIFFFVPTETTLVLQMGTTCTAGRISCATCSCVGLVVAASCQPNQTCIWACGNYKWRHHQLLSRVQGPRSFQMSHSHRMHYQATKIITVRYQSHNHGQLQYDVLSYNNVHTVKCLEMFGTPSLFHRRPFSLALIGA